MMVIMMMMTTTNTATAPKIAFKPFQSIPKCFIRNVRVPLRNTPWGGAPERSWKPTATTTKGTDY